MSDASFLGKGWAFPPAFDEADGQVRMSSDIDNINQSIDILLHTPKGSRTMLPRFGFNLSNYLFHRIDASMQAEMINAVKATLLDGEPRIAVQQVQVAVSNGGTRVQVTVAYVVKLTNSRHNHVFPFSLLEGSNLDMGG
jgi:phage baseplate assembly protein W